MTNDELLGRLTALELIAMTALGLVFANVGNDPDSSKKKAVLQSMLQALREAEQKLPPDAAQEARRYGESLLQTVGGNLLALTRTGGQSH